MTQTPPCQACGATERRLFIRHQGMELYECPACRLVYLDPMPSEGQIRALYDDVLDGATTGYFAKVESKMRRSRRRIRQLKRHLPARGRLRFLDVGSSGGFMVEAAREAGFDAWGIDLDPTSVDWARAHYPQGRYFQGTIEAFDPGGLAFDAVYCSEVIEHVADANSFINAITALMRPGGVLYLTTPDIGHRRRPRDITTWEAFCPPGHCLYFSPENLTLLLGRHGLDVFKRRLAFKPGIKLFARRR